LVANAKLASISRPVVCVIFSGCLVFCGMCALALSECEIVFMNLSHRQSSDVELIADIRSLIELARQRVAVTVNAELTLLYWEIGSRINRDVLAGERAEYGKQVLASLAASLAADFGAGWSLKTLRHCTQLSRVFPEREIVSALGRQLSWTHLKTLIYISEPVKREFYIEMAKVERWSVRQLQERIKSMLFERTAISKKPEETIAQDLKALRETGAISQDLAFRDPYVLDFLGLKDTYSESNLEDAILNELQQFISELGTDFAFLARQKRLTIDNRDYRIDLLFYHRRLRAQVAIELKLGEFDAAYKGQMELYLRWLEKHDTLEGENPPIGLILCADKNQEHVELLQLDKSNIRVAQYLTMLPSQELLGAKLHQAIARAKLLLENKESS
jgi:predicted nuclease of restriction endonuclease-like (RecB) superfamily